MRGAVLHGLDLNMIKERLMRRSYGIEVHPVFDANIHPEAKKFVDKTDSVLRCKEVMRWYAIKVRSFQMYC